MPANDAVDSPDAAASLGRLLYEFDSDTIAKGSRYHRSGSVVALERVDDQTLRAKVDGTFRYRVTLRRDGDDWQSHCTCPVGEDCKHVVATMLAWMARLGSQPATSSGGSPPPGTETKPPAKRTFRQEWEPILAAKLGRPLTPEEGAFLGRLSNVFHNFTHSRHLSQWEVQRLGFNTIESRRGPFQPAYQNWWDTPPRDPIELWQYLAFDLETSGLAIPEFMRPVTDTSAVRARMADRVRREAVQRWKHRLDQLTASPPVVAARPDPGFTAEGFELRLLLGADRWILETRNGPAASWKGVSRAQVDHLLRQSTASLLQAEGSPAVLAFLALCQEHSREHFGLAFNPGDPVSRALLHRLLSHRLARTLVVTPSGAPIVFAESPLVWQLRRAADPRDYELALHLPDGSPLPPAALHLPGVPDWYMYQGFVYTGPPPLDGSSSSAAIVPSEAIERPETLGLLRRFGTKLPAEIEGRFVSVPLRPRIECRLATDHLDHEIFVLQLLAVSDTPPVERTRQGNGWVSHRDQPLTAEPGGKIFALDFTAAEAVAARLTALGVAYDYTGERWTRRVTRNFAEEFVAWRETLPAAVEVLADGELASLLGATVTARVDFDLIPTGAHHDWFDLALALRPEDTELTPEEIALLLKARGKLVRLPGKGWRRLRVEIDAATGAALDAAGFDRDAIAEAALAGEKHRFHSLQLAQSAIADLLPERHAETLRSRARTLTQTPAPEVPAGLSAELRPYQREGFEFLAFLSRHGLGAILADDMGLGKTVQTLAWLLWLAARQPADEPLCALVVCPKSVVGTWEAETARFAAALETVRFGGTAAAPPTPGSRPRLVLANYTQLRLGAEFFTGQRWHAIVLDEGQFIKTPTSKVAQTARDLPGEHRLILTGTPIENRLLDLWSLFAFVLPGLLGPQASFKRHYAQDNPLALARLRTRVRHFLLRRTKSQVAADLPARTEEDVVVDLEGEQRKLYDAELKRARAQLLKVETPRQFDKARFNILASLLRLRQICCHPVLVDTAHAAAPSAKLDELLERVGELRDEGHQVLVFSQFVTMLELIRERLEVLGIGHLILTGQTENRDELVRQFQTDKSHTVFLLSLKAAGFGLNLTAASYVVLYDPWWNPAVEAQAIDRTHRIGQNVPVNAYRLIARGTVEEKIRALQREKSALAGAIVQEESLATVLDLESLRRILA